MIKTATKFAIALFLICASTTTYGQGLKALKALAKGEAPTDNESYMTNTVFHVDGKQTNTVNDGDKSIRFQCAISEEAQKKIKKPLNRNAQPKWVISATIKSANNPDHTIGRELWVKRGNMSSVKDLAAEKTFDYNIPLVSKGSGDLIGWLDKTKKDKVVIEIKLIAISATLGGRYVLSKGEFTVNLDGKGGPYDKLTKESTIESFKTGYNRPKITDKPTTDKILRYAKNHFAGKEIL